MLVWFTKSSVTQFNASELFLFERPYIKVPFMQKKKKLNKNVPDY